MAVASRRTGDADGCDDDPDRVAAAVIAMVDAEWPPLRFPTGTTAVRQIRAALESQLQELDAWRPAAEAVDSVPATA